MRKCRQCKKKVHGRADKIYCSIKCKNDYARQMRWRNKDECKVVDTYLHRNRTVLIELMKNKSKQTTVNKTVLDKKKFRFNYCTSTYENAQGKRYHIVYDFAWMKFSNGKVLIIRRS